MGGDKLGLPLGSSSLGNYALTAALNSDLDYVWVLSGGTKADWIERALDRDPIRRKWSVICCPEARLGQAYTLRCGVRAALTLGAKAVMILLADQPFITSEMINELRLRFQAERARRDIAFMASRYDGVARPPVIFDQRMFPQLLRLEGDRGARHLIREEPSGVCVDFDMPDLFVDVDTREDYRSLEKSHFWKS